jgi:UDP-N-acetylmuramate dehydrogenase
MQVIDHAVLAPLTTLELGGPATRLITVETREEFAAVLAHVCRERLDTPRVIGSGSNILAADDGYDGTVIHMHTSGIETRPGPDGRSVLVTAQAGHRLQDLVDLCVDRELSGIEMLSGIPGTVGATPVQNVGAYGQEVSQTVQTVSAYDWRTQRYVEFTAEQCHFGHRASRFKRTNRWTILSVTFAMVPSRTSCPLTYRAVAESAGVTPGQPAPLAVAVEAVRNVRTKKGMILNPYDIDRRSVGSVFLSPVIDAATAARLRKLKAPVNDFPDGSTRVSASWLIQEAGFSLSEQLAPNVRMSTKHFTLVADGGCTAAAFATAATVVARRVQSSTGVALTAEPDLLGTLPTYSALTESSLTPKLNHAAQ